MFLCPISGRQWDTLLWQRHFCSFVETWINKWQARFCIVRRSVFYLVFTAVQYVSEFSDVDIDQAGWPPGSAGVPLSEQSATSRMAFHMYLPETSWFYEIILQICRSHCDATMRCMYCMVAFFIPPWNYIISIDCYMEGKRDMQQSSGGERLANGGYLGCRKAARRCSVDHMISYQQSILKASQTWLHTARILGRPISFSQSRQADGEACGVERRTSAQQRLYFASLCSYFLSPSAAELSCKEHVLAALTSICSNSAGAESSLISSLTQGLWTLWGFLLN